MTTTTVLCASLLCACMCAAAQKEHAPVLACNLKAIAAADRPRYNELAKHVRAAMRDRREIANGYTFKLDGTAVTLSDAAEWINMERLCCPFLTFQLSASGNQTGWNLTLTGTEGIKPLLNTEFPVR